MLELLFPELQTRAIRGEAMVIRFMTDAFSRWTLLGISRSAGPKRPSVGARCARQCVCLSVCIPICTRVSVLPKTGFNTSDPTRGWAQWFLLCPVHDRVPVNLLLLVCCVYTKPVFLVLVFRCYKEKREQMSRGRTCKGQERERERDTSSSRCELAAAARQTRGRHTHMRVSNNSSARSRLLTGIGNKASLMTESNNYRWARCIEL